MLVKGMKIAVQGTSLNEEAGKKWKARRWLEAAAWIALVAVLWGTDLLAKYLANRQSGMGADTFRLVAEQATSAVAVLIMVLFLVHWLKLFPLTLREWPRTIIGHVIGSVFFAFGHFVLMVALRIPSYALTGRTYVWREPFANNLIVEYQKDIKIYIGFVVLISAYQYYRRARSAEPQPHTDRLVVQSGTANSIIRLEDIEYLEAARNYVSVHADGREYIIRDTMTNLSRRLSSGPFVRTHRSFIVNIDKVREIRSADTGQRIVLTSGAEVPLSRSYRDEFARRVGG
jgi:DNA-binding LytR/AlgR family response regulator